MVEFMFSILRFIPRFDRHFVCFFNFDWHSEDAKTGNSFAVKFSCHAINICECSTETLAKRNVILASDAYNGATMSIIYFLKRRYLRTFTIDIRACITEGIDTDKVAIKVFSYERFAIRCSSSARYVFFLLLLLAFL